ncbi:MAG: S9 family peptidase [SAR202 cluster bacterium]|nr:S9 family peptidase [SAR202 cluster bacterium]
MPAHFNRGATYKEEPVLPDDPLIDLLAQTNAKVEHFDLSADGRKLAYVSAESGGYDLYTCDIDGGNKKRIVTMYPEECLGPSWSPDGQWIAYCARDNMFKVKADGSEPPINLSYGRGPGTAHAFLRWTPDGKRIVFITIGPNGYMQVASVSTEIPRGRIAIKFITNEEFNSTDVFVSPDGKHVAFMSDRSGYADFKRMDVWIAPIDGGEARNMTPNTFEHYDYRPRWSPDGKKLVYTTDKSNFRKIWVVDIASGKAASLTEGQGEYDEYNPRYSPDGQWIAYVANMGWNFHLMKIKADGSGKPIQLTKRDGVHGGIDAYQARGSIRWTPDSKSIVFTFMNHEVCSDIWSISAEGGEPKQITNHMPKGLSGFQFIKPALIKYKSRDGLEVPAWLYRPKDAGNKKTPLVVYARANTKGIHVNGFYPYIQYYLHKGYTVVCPLVRGSGGLGKRYEFLNFGDWGGGDIDDFAYSAYHLAEQGLIDKDKVVMQGGSTGGYFSLTMCFRYPDLLKASVCFYGAPDLIHFWRYSAGAGKPVLGDVVAGDRGGPDMAPEHWKGRSLIYNLEKVKTPLLFFWGDRDGYSVAMGDSFFRECKAQGKYAEYVQYNCEPHGWYHWRPEDVSDSIRRIAAHFKKFTGV